MRFLILLLMLVADPAMATDCMSVTDPGDRLSCWDRSARLASATTTRGAYTAWRTEIDLSDLDGTHDVFLSVPSAAPLRCGAGRATLFLRCLGDRTAAFIWHGCDAAKLVPDTRAVTLRVDDGPIRHARWQVGGDSATLGLWEYRPARRLIEAIQNGRVLHVAFRDHIDRTHEMSFPVAGLREAGAPLRIACGWSDVLPPGDD
ncbi:type VI secretion system-associated protein TagO [Jannaschia aquimarina]|uniref:Uncharacterized protein n=1 Tax=Jannaschia aquimarina TaxID=935700 RepID=A0A0D1CIL5_9RHOB|nr:type VI secretion system-associated protein TagO [Jannaschia aquimarina]KIT14582.1 hypothetical protein jaqu_38730 [Jannaschia aquimarina]SNT34902.1 Type VI secretion system VasI, EvfG, VC_A0118 [Jannaschia aquimarina]